MPVMREPQRLVGTTTLIDIGEGGLWKRTGVYLIVGE